MDVWLSTHGQFSTMSICASTHLGAGHRANKPVKGRKFVDFLHEQAPVKGSCSAAEEGRIL